MPCPYTSPQNGKAERIIHSINNVICTLLIQVSLLGRYLAEGLHTATYLLNCLPMKTIQAACPHLALFGSAPSYEHLRVFGWCVTLTLLPQRHISSPLNPPDVPSLATPLITRAIVALISPQTI
jgi:hypothetical protein